LPGNDLIHECDRQDRIHPANFPATRDGIFLGITTAVHELDREAIEAWRAERDHPRWDLTRNEMLQAAVVILRTIRSIDELHTKQHMEAWRAGEVTHPGDDGTDPIVQAIEDRNLGDQRGGAV